MKTFKTDYKIIAQRELIGFSSSIINELYHIYLNSLSVKYLLTILCLREKTIKAVINKINNDGTPIDFFWVVKNKSNIDQLEEENKNERSSRSH